MKKLFIVFEGIDGSGTSTQAVLLKDYLCRTDAKAVITSEPSSGPIGNLIREGLKKRVLFSHDEHIFDAQMAYLFAADRHDHLFNEVDGVFRLLADDFNVISTRYYFSSLAYHCNGPDDFDFVSTLNKKFPNPDLTIYIDNPVDVSIDRMAQRSFVDRYENKEKLLRVSKNYEKVFAEYQGELLTVDGAAPIRSIHRRITAYLEERFDARYRVHTNRKL
jgi:dTMP kinase